MKTKLIELLNKLIEKGWLPFGYHEGKYGYNAIEYSNNELVLSFGEGAGKFIRAYSLRNISSIDSGLWQFVCENGMLNKKRWSNRVRLETSSVGDYIEIWTGEDYGGKFDNDYEYRLIESSLKDESELEEFLLKNIKVE